MKYNKLIRDNIPEIIKKDNKIPLIHKASNKEYSEKLIEKLLEEVEEFKKENKEEEMADILEVLYAICELKGWNKQHIEDLRMKKATKRGAFKERLILDEIKD